MEYRFDPKKAVRGQQPLLIVIVGPPFGGKTTSALRLANGMREVLGPDTRIVMGNTEGTRGSLMARQVDYEIEHLQPPYDPEMFKAFISQFADSIVIIDSFSDEHEQMLENQAELVARDRRDIKAGTKSQAAWIAIKARRNELKRYLQTHKGIVILCVRAKEPSKITDEKWHAITGDCFLHLAAACLFVKEDGRVVFKSGDVQDSLTRVVEGIRPCIGDQLDEATGSRLATWALGDEQIHGIVAAIDSAQDRADFVHLDSQVRANWKSYNVATRKAIQGAVERAKARLDSIESVDNG